MLGFRSSILDQTGQTMKDKFVPAPPAKYRYTWCGPYALAIINRLNCDDAIEGVMEALHLNKQAQGMRTAELRAACRHRSFNKKLVKKRIKLEGIDLINVFEVLKPNKLYVIELNDHYVVADSSDHTICDTKSKRWVKVERHKCAGKHVKGIFEVVKA